MTKDEWKKVEIALQSLFNTVKLKCDGYEVTVRLERKSTYKNSLMVYVNGEFKGIWLTEDCEERRRFIQHKQPYMLSVKQRAEFKNMKMSKALRKKYAWYYESRYDLYSPQWSTFAALKKHLIANNENIELISIS